MRYFALATDYDGTLAHDGVVDAATTETLIQLQASGRSLILVTGREIDDLQSVFDRLDLFAWVVAENGALLYEPSTRDEFKLAEPIDPRFAAALKRKGIEPLSTGRVIVATREPHEATTLQTIRDLGLELQVIFNKGAVMVLPTGVNKGTGLVEALKRLELSPHNVAGVGDAENDHGFLDMCELSAAVKNALPAVKERATITLKGARGDGVQELAAAMLKDDLRASSKKNGRTLLMGETNRGALVEVPVFEKNLLLAGSSGGGKSTLAKAFLERLYEQSYQFCVIDPEGDYESFEAGVVLGDRTRAPLPEEALQVLSDPEQNLVLNLLGVPLDERPKYFNTLIAELLELRARTGRPHWIVIDEAHHVLPEDSHRSGLTLSKDLTNIVMITVEPGSVLHSALDLVDMVFTVGQDPSGTMRAFAKAAKRTPPPLPRASFEKGEALVWETSKKTARRLEVAPSSFEHHRHKRKYATGDVGEQYSFYFRGPNEELNLPARNLIEFLRIARGIDPETWSFHLRRRDYSNWFRGVIKDVELADKTVTVERNRRLSPDESLTQIENLIGDTYTLPDQSKPSGIQT